jgi:hypothetical protein
MVYTISCFIKAVAGITVRCKYYNLMTKILQSHGGVDDETLCAANAKVWVEEDDVLPA